MQFAKWIFHSGEKRWSKKRREVKRGELKKKEKERGSGSEIKERGIE